MYLHHIYSSIFEVLTVETKQKTTNFIIIMQGIVQKWISHKGYGFIDCGQEQNLFVHANDLANGRQSLNIQENVTFELISDEKTGKTKAVNVNGDGSGMPPPERNDFGGNNGAYGGHQGGNGQSMQGTVQKWMSHKGYGFIDCGQDQNVFVHANDLNGRQSLNIQENVTFELITDERTGKTKAVNVNGDGSGMPPPERNDFGGNGGNNNGYGGNGQWENHGGFGGN